MTTGTKDLDVELKELGTITLGGVVARLVEDAIGRQCIEIPLADQPVLFTISHALVVREILDRGLNTLTQFAPTLHAVKEPP